MSMTVVPPLKPHLGRHAAERAAWEAEGHAAVASLRAIAQRAADDPHLGTAIGRMFVDGMITERHAAAAEAYGRLRGRFDRVMGIVRRTVASPSYSDEARAAVTEPMTEKALAELRSDHVKLIASTMSAYPILDRVIVDDETPAPREIERLRNALDRLEAFFRIG